MATVHMRAKRDHKTDLRDTVKDLVDPPRTPSRKFTQTEARAMWLAIDQIEGALMNMPELTDIPEKFPDRPADTVVFPVRLTADQIWRLDRALKECNRILNDVD